jgi:hypothetical protein
VEFDELIASIRAGNVIDDTVSGIHSTMSAILGFMAAYSGQLLDWDEALNSEIRFYPHYDVLPEEMDWNTLSPIRPDDEGYYPIPVPGETQVI